MSKLNNWKNSKINLDVHLSEKDLQLLRDKEGRKNKNNKKNIITRSYTLVIKAKKGDIDARNTLFLLHTPLMRNYLNRTFYIHPTKFDEYLSDCFEYFLNAVKSFNKKKSNNFVYFLQRHLFQGFVNKYRYNKLHNLDTINYEEIDKDYETENNFLSIDENLFNLENDER